MASPSPQTTRTTDDDIADLNAKDSHNDDKDDTTSTVAGSPIESPVKEDKPETHVHNIDQRTPTFNFEHEDYILTGTDKDSKNYITLRQYGANSKNFIGDTSSVLWPVAYHFSKWLCETYGDIKESEVVKNLIKVSEKNRKLSCIELGAGTGLCGLVLSALKTSDNLFERIVITDQTCELLRENVEMIKEQKGYNAEQSGGDRTDKSGERTDILAKKLTWGDFKEGGDIEEALKLTENNGYDLVIASDVLYPGAHEEEVDELVKTIKGLLLGTNDLTDLSLETIKENRSNPNKLALIAYEFRDDWWTANTFESVCKRNNIWVLLWSLNPQILFS